MFEAIGHVPDLNSIIAYRLTGARMSISAGEVAWVYRMLLGREASAEECDQWRHLDSVQELRALTLDSAEFRSIMARHMAEAPPPSAPPRLPLDLPPAQVEWQADPIIEAHLLDHVMRTWTALGREKPHWSVLSSEAFLPESIEASRRDFYASGADDVARILRALERHGRSPAEVRRMVEYGCGVGRVTPHLAKHFAAVTAVDISESHMAMAAQAVAESGADNVRFSLARTPEFGMAEPFDLWFSFIVLQHNPPPVIALLLRRALTMLAPSGVAIFQVPTYATAYRYTVADYLAAPTNTGTIEVHCLPQPVVFAIAAECGCRLLEVREDTAMGPPSAWLSNTFIFTKG